MWLGFVMGMSILAVGLYLITLDHPWKGVTLMTSVLVGAIGTFIYGSVMKEKAATDDDQDEDARPEPDQQQIPEGDT